MAKQTPENSGPDYEGFDEAISEARLFEEVASGEIQTADARILAARGLLEFSSIDETIKSAAEAQLDIADQNLSDAKRHLKSTKDEIKAAFKSLAGVDPNSAPEEIILSESA